MRAALRDVRVDAIDVAAYIHIIGHGLALTLTGIALGVAGALATTQVLRAYLFEIGPRDPLVLTLVGFLVVATALVASYLPARRATKVDPMVALRYE